MPYLESITACSNNPQGLEDLYQTAQKENNAADFKAGLQTCFQQTPENVLYAAWHHRFAQEGEQPDTKKVNWKLAIPLSILLSLIFWVLSLDDLHLSFSDQQPYLVQIWAPIAAGFVIIFITLVTKKHKKRAVAVIIGLVLFGAYAMYFSLAPNDRNYQILASIHLIALAWIGVGIVILGRRADDHNRFAFLIKSIEIFVIAGIYAIGGAVFVGITYGLFDTINIRIPPNIERLIFPGGAGLIILLAVASTYDPLREPATQNFRYGLSKLISTLMRLLMPLTLMVLVIFSFFILKPANFWIPFNDRDALIIYNAMLFAVVFLLVGATPVTAGDLSPRVQAALRQGIIAVAILTVLVSLYALSATVYRTYLGTLTMNRMAVIGWNTINIGLLILLVYKLFRPGPAEWNRAGQSAFSKGMIAYIAWTIFVILSVPFIFSGGWNTGWSQPAPPMTTPVQPDSKATGQPATPLPAANLTPRAIIIPTATPTSLTELPPACPPDCAELDLGGAYLPDVDLRGANLTRANLRNANLRGADLRETNLREADLRGTDLRGVNLEGASLLQTRIDQATKLDNKWRTVWQILNQSAENLDLAAQGGIDLSGADLRGANLRGANLAFASLNKTDLRGADLTGADLNYASLYQTTLDDTTLLDEKWQLVWEIVNNGAGGRNLSETNLSQTNLSGADLTYANLSRAVLTGTILSEANLYGADLRGALLSEQTPTDGEFHHAMLNRADLAGVKMDESTQIEQKWRLVWEIVNQGAQHKDLSGADLGDADLHEVNLSGVLLVGARLENADLQNANLAGADLNGAFLQNADLTGANLNGANLFEAQLNGTRLPADLTGVNFRKADLRGVNLRGADLSGLNLSRANLQGVDLSEADLSQADLSEAHLEGAYLWRANLNGANLRGAYLSHAYLHSANLTGVDFTGAEFHQTVMAGGEVYE